MANETKTYDLVIIGGGPAGIIAARSATNTRSRIVFTTHLVKIG